MALKETDIIGASGSILGISKEIEPQQPLLTTGTRAGPSPKVWA